MPDDTITVAEALASPRDAQMRLIGTNMVSLRSYLNVLKIDIKWLLDSSENRALVLDEHIDILKSYYTKTFERTTMLTEQSRELTRVIAWARERAEEAKALMESKYTAFDYTWVDNVIDSYTEAKNEENRARVYLAYVERFQRGYALLQGENKKILDTLINNRDAIVKQVIVVIPDSGNELVKKLNLITTEEAYKSNQAQE